MSKQIDQRGRDKKSWCKKTKIWHKIHNLINFQPLKCLEKLDFFSKELKCFMLNSGFQRKQFWDCFSKKIFQESKTDKKLMNYEWWVSKTLSNYNVFFKIFIFEIYYYQCFYLILCKLVKTNNFKINILKNASFILKVPHLKACVINMKQL